MPAQWEVLGDARLTIKVANAPLPEGEQGMSITAGVGNLVAIERAGIDTKEFGNYLFGDIDVPVSEPPSPIQPYDPTRSLQLDPQHPVVAVLLGFMGSNLDEVRARPSGDGSAAKRSRRAGWRRRPTRSPNFQ